MQRSMRFPAISLFTIVWGIIGLVVALANDYGGIDNGSDAWTFGLAVVLWPLIVVGADVAIRF